MERRLGVKGRVQFNVGGAQAIEDSLKLVRNATGKNLNFAFMGGYHGRTLGASSITSSFRYRRRYGHFSDRAQFIPFPYCFRCPYDKKPEDCGLYCVKQFEKLFDTEYHSVWDSKASQSEFAAFYIEPIQGTGGYVIPPDGYFEELTRILHERGILIVVDEIQMGLYRTGKFWSFEHFGLQPDIIVFGKALTNGLNPLSGVWAREELIAPDVFPPGSTHSTFSANTLGTATALEVMRMIAEHIHLDRGWNHAGNAGGQLSTHMLRKRDQRFTLCRGALLIDEQNRLRWIRIRVRITQRGICLDCGNYRKAVELLSIPTAIANVPCEQRLITREPDFAVGEALCDIHVGAAALEIVTSNLLRLARERNAGQKNACE